MKWDLVIFSSPQTSYWARITLGSLLALLALLSVGAYLVLQSKISTFSANTQAVKRTTIDLPEIQPFPVTVNPLTKTFLSDPELQTYVQQYAAPHISNRSVDRWLDRLLAKASHWSWYQQLATPESRVLVILPGERKEQVAESLSDLLNWDTTKTQEFLSLLPEQPPAFPEGTLFPGRYVLHTNATPAYAHNLIAGRFARNILARYPSEVEAKVPLLNTLTLASLLERETYDFTEMRIISGIMWNRLFIDMPLQIDATLQYARANTSADPQNWWPVPRPADKYIESPFNTYQQTGLPPAPIANPSVASVIAALNPIQTECIFYFHDNQRRFHCSPDYETHVSKLKTYFGQGR
jgi:UPF0755 protein